MPVPDASYFAYFVLVVATMLGETWRSRDNESYLRRLGAVEPPDDVYSWMQVAYPACFAAMAFEGWRSTYGMVSAGAWLFLVAKGLKVLGDSAASGAAGASVSWCLQGLQPS